MKPKVAETRTAKNRRVEKSTGSGQKLTSTGWRLEIAKSASRIAITRMKNQRIVLTKPSDRRPAPGRPPPSGRRRRPQCAFRPARGWLPGFEEGEWFLFTRKLA